MRYAWPSHSAIDINAHTHIGVCQTYNIAFESRTYDKYSLTQKHSTGKPVRFTVRSALEFRKDGDQSRNTKIEISDKVLIQSC